MNFRYLTDQQVGWECYRAPGLNLVYFVHRKCASCTYIDLFTRLNWTSCKSDTIDWDKDTVFSHIRNPLVKHRKGVVEIISKFNLIDTVIDNPALQTLLAGSTGLDVHTITIQRFLGNNAVKVNWIPIDTKSDHKEETINFIERHGQTVNHRVKTEFYQAPIQNQSSASETKLYNMLMDLPVTSGIVRYIDFDRCLYDYITTKDFEPREYSLRIEQLKSQGHEQLIAEKLADDEVASGKYLDWKF